MKKDKTKPKYQSFKLYSGKNSEDDEVSLWGIGLLAVIDGFILLCLLFFQ